MNIPLHGAKSEKFTFTIVIGILLFSLIYISGYTMLVKEENEQFRHEIKAIQQEMDVLFEFLPARDPESIHRQRQITQRVATIQNQFYQGNISHNRKQALLSQLSELKSHVGELKTHVRKVAADEQSRQLRLAAEAASVEVPEASLTEPIVTLVERIPPPVVAAPVKVIIENKLSVYYFKAFSSDPKNRHQRTRFIAIELQLKGDASPTGGELLLMEIRDPENYIINTNTERIRAATDFKTSHRFLPVNHAFKKGRYSIRIYKEDSDFQSVTFLDLM